MKKIIFIVFDGLADRPIKELGGKTPLEVAKKPNIDALMTRSRCGTQNAMGEVDYPTSEEAHFGLFGYDFIRDLPGRGVLEALGLGANLTENDLALRVDFGAVDEHLTVLDPRAGNIHSVKSFCNFIGTQKIGPFTFKLYPGIGHRAALVISGEPISKAIAHHSTVVTDTDPHKAKVHRGGNRVLRPKPMNRSAESLLTSEALWEYQLYTHELLDTYVENRVRRRQGLLPANFVLTRGAGFLKPVKKFYEKYKLKAACIAGLPLYKGIGRYLGMDLFNVEGVTGLKDTNIEAKIKKALKLISGDYDFVFVHLKGTDVIAEEEGDYLEKTKYIERADKAFKGLLKFSGTICITGDHATPCLLKDHAPDPVPIMITSSLPDRVLSFSEKDCQSGSLGHLEKEAIIQAVFAEAQDV